MGFTEWIFKNEICPILYSLNLETVTYLSEDIFMHVLTAYLLLSDVYLEGIEIVR